MEDREAWLTQKHVAKCLLCDGVDVWRKLMALLATVEVNNTLGVDRKHAIWVHYNTEESGIGLHCSVYVCVCHVCERERERGKRVGWERREWGEGESGGGEERVGRVG